MRKTLIILFILVFNSNVYSDTLGSNKSINDYLENGYEIQSINVINNNKFLYNLLNSGFEEKIFEPKFISCVYEKEKQITDCFKP